MRNNPFRRKRENSRRKFICQTVSDHDVPWFVALNTRKMTEKLNNDTRNSRLV